MPFERKDGDMKAGFSITMSIGFPNFSNQQFEKVLFELGRKNIFHSRLRLVYFQNRIYFEIIDEQYHKISVSASIADWKIGDQKFLHADFSLQEKRIFLFIHDKIVDDLKFDELKIENDFLEEATGIIGNSLELRHPCQFIIGMHSIGKSIGDKVIMNYSKAWYTYLEK